MLCGLGLFVGIGFALPALGMNSHGPNSVAFTLKAEAVAVALYSAGAVMSWLAAVTARKAGYRVWKSGRHMIPLYLLPLALPLILRGSRGDWTGAWESEALVLLLGAGLGLPWLIGLRPQWPLVARRH
jgi:hypothetical protein